MDVLKKIKTIRLLRLLAPMLAGLALAYGLVVFVLSLNDGVSTTFLKWTVLGLALFTFAVVLLITMFTGKQARSLADYVIEVEKQYNSDDKIIRTLSKKYNAVYYADLDTGDVRFLEIGNRVASYMSEVYREKHNLEWYARAYADRILEGYQKEKFLGEVNCDNLKEINDRYGHDKGDIYINIASYTISDVFKRSPVFRIGGDEVAVILKKDDIHNMEALIELFDETSKQINESADKPWEHIYVSKGFAVFDPALDSTVVSVLQRADKLMYENKRERKAADGTVLSTTRAINVTP